MSQPFGPEDYELNFGDLSDPEVQKRKLFDEFYGMVSSDLINSRRLTMLIEELQEFELTDQEIGIVTYHLDYILHGKGGDVALMKIRLIRETNNSIKSPNIENSDLKK